MTARQMDNALLLAAVGVLFASAPAYAADRPYDLAPYRSDSDLKTRFWHWNGHAWRWVEDRYASDKRRERDYSVLETQGHVRAYSEHYRDDLDGPDSDRR